MAYRAEQRGSYAVDLGKRASGGRHLLETFLPEGDGSLGGESLKDPTILRSQ
jgi:hypothetical protein